MTMQGSDIWETSLRLYYVLQCIEDLTGQQRTMISPRLWKNNKQTVLSAKRLRICFVGVAKENRMIWDIDKESFVVLHGDVRICGESVEKSKSCVTNKLSWVKLEKAASTIGGLRPSCTSIRIYAQLKWPLPLTVYFATSLAAQIKDGRSRNSTQRRDLLARILEGNETT